MNRNNHLKFKAFNLKFNENTNQFFRKLAKMNLTSDLQISFTQTTENNYVVSVLLKNEQCGDEARKTIPLLNLRGTAEDLDNGFFENITQPLQTASGLMVDMEGFMKQLEVAKKESAMEKEKSDKVKKEKETKDKKYNESLQKAEELVKEGNIKKHGLYFQKVQNITNMLNLIPQQFSNLIKESFNKS